MMRSQTDEMLAEKWDPEPWEHADGIRRATAHDASGEWSRLAEFAPRVECIPSRLQVIDWAGIIWAGTDYKEAVAVTTLWTGSHVSTVQRPPVNPILVAFREYGEAGAALWAFAFSHVSDGVSWDAWDYVDVAEDAAINATPEQIDHARKVLTRLAALK